MEELVFSKREEYIDTLEVYYAKFLRAIGYTLQQSFKMAQEHINQIVNNSARAVIENTDLYKRCGVYLIINIITNQTYIGSSVDIKQRKYHHIYCLRKNKYERLKLQRSWNKYGAENFIFIPLEFCSSENRIDREQHYIDQYNPYFNNKPKAGLSNTGFRHHPSSIKKMSAQKKGKSFHSEYQIQKLRELGKDPIHNQNRLLGIKKYWENYRKNKK